MLKWLKDAKRLPQVERALEEANERARISRDAAYNAEAEASAARKSLQEATSKLTALETKVREQNEADLLLVSLQIVQRITAGEKKETSHGLRMALDQQASLRSYQNQLGPYHVGGSMLHGLGLGGIFGQLPH